MTIAILVHKLGAGTGEHSRGELEAALRKHGYEPRYVPMESGAPVDLCSVEADAIVVAGGDGTFRALLPQLRQLDLPIILMPLGTANNVARSLGIGGAHEALAPDGVIRPLDLGLCSVDGAEFLFSEAAGLGALAAMLRHGSGGASGQEKLERGRRCLSDLLSEIDPFFLRLETDNGVVQGNFVAAEILNTQTAGPSLTLSPQTDPGDGLLDLFCVEAADRDAFRAWLQSDRKSAAPGIRRRASHIRFDWDGQADFRIDDRLMERPSVTVQVEIGLAAQSLQMRLPARYR